MSVAIDNFPKKDRPPIAELRNEIAELMPRIGCGKRFRAFGNFVAGKDARAFVRREGFGVKAQFLGKRAVQQQEPGPVDDRRMRSAVERGAQPGIAVIEGKISGHGLRTAFLASPVGIAGLATADGVPDPHVEK